MAEKIDYRNIELPEELLISFAKSMVPEIRAFYRSEKGREYYSRWLERHPEYNTDLTASALAHSTVNPLADTISVRK
ncbi:MAG: hypothetical protein IJD81_00480 [Oscillospiraceae bacterium]|nr:hypothetical protein [Oscillospiraceae bacterium]